MRRWIVCLYAVVCVGILGGCAGTRPTAPTEPVTEGFSCRIAADYDGLVFKGQMTRKLASTLTLELEEPPTLAGLTLTLKEDALTAQLHGIHATIDPAQLPQAGAIPLLLNALDAAATLTEGGESTAEGLTFRGEIDGVGYTLVSDADSGNLLTLELPDVPMTVLFSDFQRLTTDTTVTTG